MEGDKKIWKRKKRRSFVQQAKKEAKRRRFGKGSQLDDDTYQYFLRIMEVKYTDFETQEEKDVFVNNVFAQLEGQEAQCCFNQLASRVIEGLIPWLGDEAFENFASKFSRDLRPICTDPYASHVLETLLMGSSIRAPPHSVSAQDKPELNLTSRIHDWRLQVCSFVLNNLEEFVWNTYANHVIRICLVSIGPTLRLENKIVTDEELERLRASVNSKNKDMLIEYASRLIKWPQLTEMVYDTLASGLLQTMLKGLHSSIEDKWCKKFVKKLLDDCFLPAVNNETEDKETKMLSNGQDLPAVFYSEPALRLMETAISVSPTAKLSTQLYAFLFAGRLTVLAKQPLANFTVQKLLNHCSSKEEFEAMFDEMAVNLEDIFSSGNSGVIVSLAQACVRLSTRQSQFLKNLMKALHCGDSEQNKLTHLILQLVTYEQWKATEEQFSVQHNGSVLLQTLLKFNKPIKFVNNLMEMNASELKTLFCDPKGSYVMDSFMKSEYVGEKSRERMVRKLQGSYIALACSRNGSRALDAVWTEATMKQKHLIMEELASKEAILNSNKYGSIICRKYGCSLFNHKVQDWKDAEGRKLRTKELFADIIGDVQKVKS